MQKSILSYHRKQRALRILSTLFRHIFMIGVSYIMLYPLLYMLSNAFKPVDEYYDPGVVWIPKNLTIENLRQVTLIIKVKDTLIDTLIVSVIPAVISTMTCMMYGYGLATFQFRGKKLIIFCLFLTIIIPQQTIATSLYAVFRNLDFLGLLGALGIPQPNLINTAWVSILPAFFGVGLKNGLFVFIYMQFFAGHPKELREAADVDGCGPFRTFTRIVAPTAKNINIAVLLLAVVWYWNDYYTPVMFMRTKNTMAMAMHNFKTNLENATSLGIGITDIKTADTQVQAACLIAIVPLIILYVFLQKRFSEGIENSGLTGL